MVLVTRMAALQAEQRRETEWQGGGGCKLRWKNGNTVLVKFGIPWLLGGWLIVREKISLYLSKSAFVKNNRCTAVLTSAYSHDITCPPIPNALLALLPVAGATALAALRLRSKGVGLLMLPPPSTATAVPLPSVFGRNAQCQPVRGSKHPRGISLVTHTAALQAEQIRETQWHPRV